MNDLFADKLAIREIVENWVLYRDAGDWERFATVWHSGWLDDSHLVSGTSEGFYRSQPQTFRSGRQHPASARRLDLRYCRVIAPFHKSK